MEDIKLFFKLVRREYPNTKFGHSSISGYKKIMIMVFTDDSECVKFSEQVNSFLGNEFRLRFFSMKEWNRVNKNEETPILDWFIKVVQYPSGFIRKLFN
jgi:hypothetical protein